MTITIEQHDEINRIKRKRKREAYFMATLDFLSALATLVCVYSDAIGIFGVALILGGPITIGVGLLLGVFAISLVAGIFWARKRFNSHVKSAQEETDLMAEAYEAGFTEHDLQPETEQLTFSEKAIKYISKAGNRIMSMFFNFGTMLGLAGVIFGAASISLAAALTPVGWGVLIAAAVIAIAFGVASVIAEYYVTREHEEHKALLQDKIKNNLEDKIVELGQQNAELQHQNAELEQEKNGLQERNSELQREAAELRAERDRLAQENVELRGRDEILRPSVVSIFQPPKENNVVHELENRQSLTANGV